MAGLIARVKGFLRSPQGQQAVRKVKQAAQDPQNQEKIRKALGNLRGKKQQRS